MADVRSGAAQRRAPADGRPALQRNSACAPRELSELTRQLEAHLDPTPPSVTQYLPCLVQPVWQRGHMGGILLRPPSRRVLYAVGAAFTVVVLLFQFHSSSARRSPQQLDEQRWASSRGGHLMGDIQNATLGVSRVAALLFFPHLFHDLLVPRVPFSPRRIMDTRPTVQPGTYHDSPLCNCQCHLLSFITHEALTLLDSLRRSL